MKKILHKILYYILLKKNCVNGTTSCNEGYIGSFKIDQNGQADFIDSYIPVVKNTRKSFGSIICNNTIKI